MLDGFARSITYLRISITDRCNYRCRYCMPDGGIEKCAHEDICSLEGLRDMAAAAVRCGVKKIRVTGGEPLVRRGAVDFCRMLSEIPGVEELCVTTNGSLLKEFAQPLRDAGVTHPNISLDTLNEERFRAITRLGTLQDTLDLPDYRYLRCGLRGACAARRRQRRRDYRFCRFDTRASVAGALH